MERVWVETFFLICVGQSVVISSGVDFTVPAATDDAEAITEIEGLKDQLFSLVKKPIISQPEKIALEELISRVGINATDGDGLSLLHWRVVKGSVDALEILLNINELDVNFPTPLGRFTALHQAMVRGGKVLIMLLRRPDINVNAQNKDGSTPLQLAVSKGLIHSIRILLSMKGSEVNLAIQDNSEASAMDLARRESKHEAVEQLRQFMSLDAPIVPLQEEDGHCAICLEDRVLKKLSCGHQFCLFCLQRAIFYQYENIRPLFDNLKCPHRLCTAYLTRNDIGALMAPMPDLYLYLNAYKSAVLHKMFLQEAVVVSQFREDLPEELRAFIASGEAAPHADCGAVVMKDAGCNYVNCRCGVKFCYLCGVSTPTPGHDCKAGLRDVAAK